eukprot:3251667-Pyramimonas_sp.AAC.3
MSRGALCRQDVNMPELHKCHDLGAEFKLKVHRRLNGGANARFVHTRHGYPLTCDSQTRTIPNLLGFCLKRRSACSIGANKSFRH